MDEGCGPGAILIVILIAIPLLIVAAVLALAVLVPAILLYWALALLATILLGMLLGFGTPFLVLTGRSLVKPTIATPELVSQGKVVRRARKGYAKHLARDYRDRAWPLYLYYQATRDVAAVSKEIRQRLADVRGRLFGHQPRNREGFGGAVVIITWAIAVPILYAGLFIGAWLAYWIWLLVTIPLGLIVYAVQEVWTLTYRSLDRLRMRRARGSVKCPACYAESSWPGFRCPNPNCAIVHLDVSPGPLGIHRRICECGTTLPTTVSRCSQKLVAVCPRCQHDLAGGSGMRHTVQLPVFGGVGAGKTRLLAASLVAGAERLSMAEGSLQPLTESAGGFLRAAQQVQQQSLPTDKTAHAQRPESLPMLLEDAEGHLTEVQLLDASGETFRDDRQSTDELTYLASSEVLVFAFDPLALPGICEELRQEDWGAEVLVATGDQEGAYAAVRNSLSSRDLKSKQLAFVLTKADILQALPAGHDLDVSTPSGVRNWLRSKHLDGLIRLMEIDFGNVTYFAVNSSEQLETTDPMNPLHVLDWALRAQGTSWRLIDTSSKVIDP